MLHNYKLDTDYYNVEEARDILLVIAKHTRHTGKRKRMYFDIAASFDIETTSFYDDEGNKQALMYVWQFCIIEPRTRQPFVIVGRTWKEFLTLMQIIKQTFEKAHTYFPIYVHNLAFEFSFLEPILRKIIDEVFATRAHTPIYFRVSGIEFRCSYFLSGMGLQYLPTERKKLVGDLDYDKSRHALTPLTDEEMAYCLQDVLVLSEYIQQKLDQHGRIIDIPLTKTGYVRKGLIDYCIGDDYVSDKKEAYIKQIRGLEITPKEYVVLREAYMGGHTATSPWYHGRTVDNVTCYDFTSSYPAVMCYCDDFPISKRGERKKLCEEDYRTLMKQGYALISKITFRNIRVKKDEIDAWISEYKAHDVEYFDKNDKKINNGKITRAKKLTLFCTEVDIKVYEMFYDWDSFEAEHVFIYDKGYLPREVILYTLELYRDKTTLKGVEGQELYYTLRKELLNSLYGCSVTDPCKPEIIYKNGEWTTEKQTEKKLIEKVDKYNVNIEKGKVAMPYHFGVYISALARYNLALGIYAAGKRDLWCYADTDSIYCTKAEKLLDFITAYNDNVVNRLKKMSDYYNIPEELWRPKTVKGEEKILGVWDFDGHSKHFKALGAKRYIKWTDDDKLKITIAGLSKKNGAEYMVEQWGKDGKCTEQIFEHFENSLEIPKGRTGKLTHSIITYTSKGTLIDYEGTPCKYRAMGGTHLEPCGFSLSLDAMYLSYLLGIKEEMDYNG